VVSIVLVAERKEEGQAYPVQRPVYYVIEILADAKTRYMKPQKLLYALLITSRKHHHYFQAQKIVVPSSFPIGEIIRNYDANGHIIKAIYSPETRSHTSTHSPSAAEEQRREGHHLGEERVELVV
jgi:hypothetical protein